MHAEGVVDGDVFAEDFVVCFPSTSSGRRLSMEAIAVALRQAQGGTLCLPGAVGQAHAEGVIVMVGLPIHRICDSSGLAPVRVVAR